MKKALLFWLLVFSTSVFLCCPIKAQENPPKEFIYLKNGTVIRGTIISHVPNESITVQTEFGNLVTIQIEDTSTQPVSGSSAASGQDENLELINEYHFDLYNNTDIIWRKTFTSDLDMQNLRETLIGLNIFDRILINKEKQLVGTLLPIKSRYKEMGRRWMTTDFIASEVEIWGKVTIDFKDGAYRVTLSNIAFKATVSPSAYSSPTDFEEIFIKRDGSIKRMDRDNLDIYNYTFDASFSIKNELITHDEW